MSCKSCLIEEIEYEVKFRGGLLPASIPSIIEHFNRRRMEIKVVGKVLYLKESGVKEFVDFWTDHMNEEETYFRVQHQDWRPLSDLGKVLEMQWIDEVIKKELITSYFQPIVNEKEEVFAYEILARFKREDGTLIYPSDIFMAAKNRGRLYALDRLCRMTAVRNAVVLKNKKAFINFIPTSIYSPEYCLQSTVKIARETGVDPSQLVFEVVETEKVDDVEHLKRILTYYKERGFEYALDDVGEGFSTIEMLEDIAPHYMKLDMQFVQGVARDLKKQQTANQLLQKALKIDSIPLAEGVELREDFEWLKQTGYQLFQGYLFGKPAPSPE